MARKEDKSRIDENEVEDEVVVEDAEDGTKGMEGNHASNLKSVAMHKVAGMSKPEVELFLKSMDTIGKEADSLPANATKEHNQGSLKMHPSDASAAIKESIKEDLATIFGDDQNLSEDFKEKITTLFESAVGARVGIIETQMQEVFEESLNEELQTITEDLLGKMDEYLGYICEEWIKENEVAIQSTLLTESTVEFMNDLADLLRSHHFNIPEDRVDVVEMLTQKVEELENTCNEVMNENMELKEGMKDYTKDDLVSHVAEGLTQIQAEKFATLTEGIDYEGDNEAFVKKLEVIKEAHFPKNLGKKSKVSSGLIVEEIAHDPNEETNEPKRLTNPDMRPFVAALSNTIRQTR